MRKVWNIYYHNVLVGQANKLNNVFAHIEAVEGKKLKYWHVTPMTVKWGNYEAKREEIH